MIDYLGKTYISFAIKAGVATKDKDWKKLKEVFVSYGGYLELVGVPRPTITAVTAVALPHRPLIVMEV